MHVVRCFRCGYDLGVFIASLNIVMNTMDISYTGVVTLSPFRQAAVMSAAYWLCYLVSGVVFASRFPKSSEPLNLMVVGLICYCVGRYLLAWMSPAVRHLVCLRLFPG